MMQGREATHSKYVTKICAVLVVINQVTKICAVLVAINQVTKICDCGNTLC